MMGSSPLHEWKAQQPHSTIYKVQNLIHATCLLAMLYYRASSLFLYEDLPTMPWLLIFASEILLCFIWLLRLPFRWRPVHRTVFPERLPGDDKLPAVDVFICTADPNQEPTLEVMNTVVSAMCLDYPPEKLSVYLSDDAGSPLTLYALHEAASFANSWVPFCRRFRIGTICPDAFFSSSSSAQGVDTYLPSMDFNPELEEMKSKYELFKERLQKAKQNHQTVLQDCRPSLVEGNIKLPNQNPVQLQDGSQGTLSHLMGLVLDGSSIFKVHLIAHNESPDSELLRTGTEQSKIPLLVYVSREKRTTHPHHFKAGALNVLLRVSGIISNAPYILVLDCDMYCNNPSSVRQAMCFHLDPKVSHSLAFVQFPQVFYNVCHNDIYDGQMRSIFKTFWPCMDGLEGPILSGTGFYIKRKALYGNPKQEDDDLIQLRTSFGYSNRFIASLHPHNHGNPINEGLSSKEVLREVHALASCSYEEDTQWGEQKGFMYFSIVEDYFTGFIMQCRGWNSVFYCPASPAFLGSSTITFNESMIQNLRWNSGLLEVGVSRFCPITHGVSRMSIPQTMCYGYFAFQPLYSLPLLCYATIPQICLFNGISLYPKVSNPWFIVFLIIYISSLSQHLLEVFLSGNQNSLKTWWNEQRNWMIKSVASYSFSCLDVLLKTLGIRKANFRLTSKVIDEEQVEQYKKGIFHFQGSKLFLVTLVTLITINIVSLVGGLARAVYQGKYDDMFGQVFLSFAILTFNYPIIEGMVFRKDNGRISTFLSVISLMLSIIFLFLGSFFFF